VAHATADIGTSNYEVSLVAPQGRGGLGAGGKDLVQRRTKSCVRRWVLAQRFLCVCMARKDWQLRSGQVDVHSE
jgi:hypothetical protein